MLFLTSSWKNSIYLFLIVFLGNSRKSCTPIMEIYFPHDKILHEKILPRDLFSQPSPHQKKSPWKCLYTSQEPLLYVNKWRKFVTCSPSPGDCGRLSHPKRQSYLEILIRWLWEKMRFGGGLGALRFFGHLRRTLELLISVRMSPLATFQDHWVDTTTPGEKNNKKTNKWTRICDLSSCKKYKISHFCRYELKYYRVGFSDTLNLMVWFSLKFYDF